MERLIDEMTVHEMVAYGKELTRRIPAAYQAWGVTRTREFKKAASAVCAHLRLKQPLRHLLLRDLKALKVFY